jgi:putative acetyltransferase
MLPWYPGPTTMNVRDATEADRTGVLRAHREAVRALEPGAYTREQLAAWDHERDPDEYPIADECKALVVADRDGTVAGFGQMDLETAEVEAVYVHGDHTGEGVGSALLSHLEGRAAGRGHRAVTLLASKNARGFYERAGYRATGRETVEQPDGVEMECVRMCKELANGGAGHGGTITAREWGRLPA